MLPRRHNTHAHTFTHTYRRRTPSHPMSEGGGDKKKKSLLMIFQQICRSGSVLLGHLWDSQKTQHTHTPSKRSQHFVRMSLCRRTKEGQPETADACSRHEYHGAALREISCCRPAAEHKVAELQVGLTPGESLTV